MKTVRGWGPEVSPLMIVGDYPTKEDVEKERAFSGSSGALVADFLKQNGYSLEKCFKTLYIKCPLVGFNSKDKKKSKEALTEVHKIADWKSILIEEIKAIEPNVILVLGELAFEFLTNEKNINRFRGSILPLSPENRSKVGLGRNIRVVPSFSPRNCFSDPLASVYVKLDYAKSLKFLNNTREIEEPGNLWIARNAEALSEYWKRAKSGEFLVTDIETRYNFPICASLCVDGIEAVSFPLLDNRAGTLQNACIWAKYAEILRSNIPKVNQNMIYDWTVLERFGFTINNIVGDTMLMSNTIYPELPKGLDFLTSIYTDMTYYKDEGKEYDSKIHDFERLLYYNAKDSLATWKVWKLQQQDANDLGVKHFYFNYVHKWFFHYKKINDRGICVDDVERFALLEKYTNLLEKHSAEVNRFYGQPLNVRSPKQVGIFLYEYLNCPLHTHTTPNGNEAYSTDEDTIVNLYLNEISDDVIKKILRQIILCRKIESILNLLETPFSSDDRMRTSYNLGGTTTGRTSTAQQIGWFVEIDKGRLKSSKLGTAFQKIPKHGTEFEGEIFGADLRNIFVPTPGYSLFNFDGKNAEGRVVCVLAEDWETLDYIEAGNDLHKLTASWIYNDKPFDKITKFERDMGKRARHAGNLGQTGAGLSPQVYKSIKYCNEVMKKFHERAPKVQGIFQREIERHIENQRFLINPFGRRRDFFGYSKAKRHDTYKEGYSYIPQGTVSDHFKIISLHLADKAPWAYQLAEMHDGLLYEIPTDKRDEFAELAYEESLAKINFQNCSITRNHELSIPVEMEYSEESWGNMQEIHPQIEKQPQLV